MLVGKHVHFDGYYLWTSLMIPLPSSCGILSMIKTPLTPVTHAIVHMYRRYGNYRNNKQQHKQQDHEYNKEVDKEVLIDVYYIRKKWKEVEGEERRKRTPFQQAFHVHDHPIHNIHHKILSSVHPPSHHEHFLRCHSPANAKPQPNGEERRGEERGRGP
jgi:hypothetical protein